MKTTNLLVFALLGLLAVGCSSTNPHTASTNGTSSTNSEDAALMKDIKQGHDTPSSVDKPSVTGGSPGPSNGPGATPQ